ncbi:hypothetical protein Plhal304r1_c020g0071091 [Plasmopara halstedii]
MVTFTCLQFSSLKCLVGISLCFTLHSAVSHVNDRGQVGPGPQHLPTHNTSALLNDSFPLHDAAQKSELDIDASVEDARLFSESIVSGAHDKLTMFFNTFVSKESVLRKPLLSNIERSHSSVEHNGNALKSDLSSGVKDVIFDGRNDGKASAVSNLLKLPSRSEKQDDELLSSIQQGQRSNDESVAIFYDFALIHMLKHKTSAQVVHKNWVTEGVTIYKIEKFLRKHLPDEIPFFKSEMASLWLSHVGYRWKHGVKGFTVDDLLKYFEQIKLMEDDVVRMAVGARHFFGGQDAIDQMQKVMMEHLEWQHLAFLMEMDGLDGLKHFYRTCSQTFQLSNLFRYAAFALDRESITKTDVSTFLLLEFSQKKAGQLDTFHNTITGYERSQIELKAPLTPNDQTQGVVFRQHQAEPDQKILARKAQYKLLIDKFAYDMLEYVKKLEDPL